LLAPCLETSQNEIVALDIQRLKNIKLLILDVDGVMTDTRIWMDTNGQWRRFYSIRDGVGIVRMIEAGYKLAVITGSVAEDIQARVQKLGIHYFYEGALEKETSFSDLQAKTMLLPSEMAFVGDDIYDIPLLKEVGFAATVPEAVDEVKDVAHYVTARAGGLGAVREVCDILLKYGSLSQKTMEKSV
jgi:3-deoxy-D-manno-octulosonate 8-phosphate phosphatase (KDO 8-P phosphatase)